MLKKHSVGNFLFSISIMTIFCLLYFSGSYYKWALNLLVFILPVTAGLITFFYLHKRYHEVLKKFFESLIAFFSLCGYGYYLYMITNVDSKLTFTQVFSSLLGYLFLTLITSSGVIKCSISIKEFFQEKHKLHGENNNTQNDLTSKISINDNNTFISIRASNSNDIYASVQKENKIVVSLKNK
ncbi:hypothetical protein Xbud_00265 [Xenorhabdus budapestensis]|uniref:Uncharacterized protein n=1 Tax=Xenorhabdus budapestensis TaxID=290110 RepID=A0A2D0J5E2_XENBU|nr:hypothetical protein Xbud_00265 [Xenorhabdus budapestensis]